MPCRQQSLIARGEIWDAKIPGVGTHPVLIATRDTAIPLLTALVCVLVTSVLVRRRGRLGPDKSVQFDRAISIALGLA